MMWPVRRWAPLVAAFLLVSCARGGGGFGPDRPPTTGAQTGRASPTPTASGPGRKLTVTTPGFSFHPSDLEVHTNETLVLELHNTDARQHALDVDGFNLHMLANPGETTRLTITISAAPGGVYHMYCSIPGHEGNGQTGTIRVT
jgi:plastocyanin